MQSPFYTREIQKANSGKILAGTLQSIGGEATTDDLLSTISYHIGQPEEHIEMELKKTLREAVRNGFLVRTNRKYSFPKYDVDSQRRSSVVKDKERLAIASRAQNKRRRAQSVNQARTRSRSRQTKSKSKSGSR